MLEYGVYENLLDRAGVLRKFITPFLALCGIAFGKFRKLSRKGVQKFS